MAAASKPLLLLVMICLWLNDTLSLSNSNARAALAPVVQGIEQWFPKPSIAVRVGSGVQKKEYGQ